VNNKDAVLFPERIENKYALFHRPMAGNSMGIWIAYSHDLIHWHSQREIMLPKYDWEGYKIGASTPPLRTHKGWLLFYHGVDDEGVYRAGVSLFELDKPDKLIGKCSTPVLEPEQDYELIGKIPRVVFPCGAVEFNDKYYIYYGTADKVIAVATVEKEELLAIFK